MGDDRGCVTQKGLCASSLSNADDDDGNDALNRAHRMVDASDVVKSSPSISTVRTRRKATETEIERKREKARDREGCNEKGCKRF